MAREKILVVDPDLNSLSRIYLALTHRKFKVEACNKPEEVVERLKRFKPSVIILGPTVYDVIREKLKIPAIVIAEKENMHNLNDGDLSLKKPVQIDELIKTVEKFI